VGSPFIGEIRMVGFNFAPLGWAFCDGSLQQISQNDALYSLIGTTYGGDGVNTFALPDLRGRIPVHMGTDRQGTNWPLGALAGTETVTLTVPQLPVHNHGATGVSGSANGVTSPTNNTWGGVTAGNPYTDQPPDNTTMNSSSVGFTGGSNSHDNLMPFLTINFVISLYGVFPSQT
jgi:microcystin-dependent protein